LALDGSDLIKSERLFLDLILSIHLRSNVPYLTTFLQSMKIGERQGGAMASGRDPFYSLAAAETGHKNWSTGRQLSRRLVTVRMASLCSLLASCLTNYSKRRQKTLIWWLRRVRRVLDLQAKFHTMGCAIYRDFR
jgi:hypothetical protein